MAIKSDHFEFTDKDSQARIVERIEAFLTEQKRLEPKNLRGVKMSKGYIYIMTNPSFSQFVKIGWAADVEQRKRDLDASSAVPYSFKIYATLSVDDIGNTRSDVFVHNLIGMLRPELRSVEKNDAGKIVRQREFFQMEAEEAYELLEQIAGLNHGELKRYGETKKDREETEDAEASRSKYEETLIARHEYWESFFAYADQDPEYVKVFKEGRKAPTDHWVDVGCRAAGGHISLTINTRQKGIAVEFYIPKNKKLYAKLLAQRDAIEMALGFKPEWQALEEKDASRIIIRNELGDFRKFDNATRNKAFRWMKDAAIVMGRTFQKFSQ